MKKKKVYIIAGPNGSGKTTFATKFLPKYAKCPNFINADLIAQGLSPFFPNLVAIKAGKLVLEQIEDFSDRNLDFAFETTLAGKSYVQILEKLRKKGYSVHLFFLWIPTTELAIARIKDRVAEGGHNVPIEDVKRRFRRSMDNFIKLYRPLLDSWMLFDNSGSSPSLIAQATIGKVGVMNRVLYYKITNDKRE